MRVDGEPRPKSHRLAGGELLEVDASERRDVALEPETRDLRIAYEDEHLLVVDKPAGMVVHPSAGHSGGTLVQALLERGIAGGDVPERPGIVHRLDRDTSGLLVVARSQEAYARLQDLVRQRALDRRYLALVRGRPRSRTGRIEAPIGRDRHDPLRRSLDTDTPREAITHFEIERLLSKHALLSIRLETGRTHQIRVHLSAIDLPVVGDPVYGVPDPKLGRQFLHANRLSFTHPFGGAIVAAQRASGSAGTLGLVEAQVGEPKQRLRVAATIGIRCTNLSSKADSSLLRCSGFPSPIRWVGWVAVPA